MPKRFKYTPPPPPPPEVQTEWVEAPEPKVEQLKQQNNMESRFFNDNTWRNATPSCTRADMNDEFVARLVRTRERANTPFFIKSAARTREHELRQGRSGNSSHVPVESDIKEERGARAVDIRCTESRARFHIISAAIQEGFTRIGVHPNFIHLDDSPTHDQQVVWFY